jgi:hypothetical protein
MVHLDGVRIVDPRVFVRTTSFSPRREGPRKIGMSNCQSEDRDRMSRRREKTNFMATSL